MYRALFLQMKKQLVQLDTWLDAAIAYAKDKSFDPEVFVGLRLAPDQLAFAKQIQIACDTAKLGVVRLTGKEVPVHEDKEKTIEELRARVRWVIGFLGDLEDEDFAAAATRTVTNPRWEGKTMAAPDHFLEHTLPNFYFHVTHVYALLRHNGVPLGKRDYLGPLSLRG